MRYRLVVLRLAVLALACVAACRADTPLPAPPPKGVELVDAPMDTRDVAALVRTTAARVAAQHRRLVVYVGATWCEPCQQFHAAAAAHELDRELPDVTFLVFDFDRDELALNAAGYTSQLIPLFALPGPDGRAGPKRVSGGMHGIDNVPLLTRKLHALLD